MVVECLPMSSQIETQKGSDVWNNTNLHDQLISSKEDIGHLLHIIYEN